MEFDLPPVVSAADAVQASAAIVAAVATGEITPDEAQAVVSVVEIQRRRSRPRTWPTGSRRSRRG